MLPPDGPRRAVSGVSPPHPRCVPPTLTAMDVGFDPISAVIAAAALGLALWERHKRHLRERLQIKAVLDADESGDISVRIDLTNREPTAVFPDAFTFQTGD